MLLPFSLLVLLLLLSFSPSLPPPPVSSSRFSYFLSFFSPVPHQAVMSETPAAPAAESGGDDLRKHFNYPLVMVG